MGLEKGMEVAVKDKTDNKWYRAKIIDKTDDRFFIEYLNWLNDDRFDNLELDSSRISKITAKLLPKVHASDQYIEKYFRIKQEHTKTKNKSNKKVVESRKNRHLAEEVDSDVVIWENGQRKSRRLSGDIIRPLPRVGEGVFWTDVNFDTVWNVHTPPLLVGVADFQAQIPEIRSHTHGSKESHLQGEINNPVFELLQRAGLSEFWTAFRNQHVLKISTVLLLTEKHMEENLGMKLGDILELKHALDAVMTTTV